MTYQEKICLMERMISQMKRKATGGSKEFARKFDVSERTLYYLINQMKEMGAPIYFNRHRGSYCLKYDVNFIIGFVPLEDIAKIKGGANSIFLEDFYRLQLFLQ